MKFYVRIWLIILLLWSPAIYAKQLSIFACEPEWGALSEVLAGDQARVFVATTALQDPHHIQARPSLIAQVRRADLVICTGADLEIGWLPLLLRRANNRRILPGAPGYFLASDAVQLRDIPARVDRSQGDIHPAGNPHIHLDPYNILRIARPLTQALQQIDPQNSDVYQSNLITFSKQWLSSIHDWEERAKVLSGTPIVVYHDNWTYLNNWLGLEQITTLEPKPGIPPSTRNLIRIRNQLESTPAAMVIRAPYQDQNAVAWIARQANIPEVTLPFTIGGDSDVNDLFSLFNNTIDILIANYHSKQS